MISFNDIKIAVDNLDITKPDLIVYLRRGGMFLAMLVAYKYDIRNFVALDINSYEGKFKRELELPVLSDTDKEKFLNATKVLVVDDIIDTGDTLEVIEGILKNNYNYLKHEVLTIIDKKGEADYTLLKDTEGWIEFPWDKWTKK